MPDVKRVCNSSKQYNRVHLSNNAASDFVMETCVVLPLQIASTSTRYKSFRRLSVIFFKYFVSIGIDEHIGKDHDLKQ